MNIDHRIPFQESPSRFQKLLRHAGTSEHPGRYDIKPDLFKYRSHAKKIYEENSHFDRSLEELLASYTRIEAEYIFYTQEAVKQLRERIHSLGSKYSVEPAGCFVNLQFPSLCANPDFVIKTDLGDIAAVVEVKTFGSNNYPGAGALL